MACRPRMVPIARALADRGHDVAVFNPAPGARKTDRGCGPKKSLDAIASAPALGGGPRSTQLGLRVRIAASQALRRSAGRRSFLDRRRSGNGSASLQCGRHLHRANPLATWQCQSARLSRCAPPRPTRDMGLLRQSKIRRQCRNSARFDCGDSYRDLSVGQYAGGSGAHHRLPAGS